MKKYNYINFSLFTDIYMPVAQIGSGNSTWIYSNVNKDGETLNRGKPYAKEGIIQLASLLQQ